MTTRATRRCSGRKALFRPEGDAPPVREACCLAHVRRKFVDLFKMNGPGAAEALVYIGYLYGLEDAIRDRPAEQKRRSARPLERLGEKQCTSAPGGTLHKAIAYALKRWMSLQTYLEDGRVPVDNNRCERAIRPVAMGRNRGCSRVCSERASGWRG